MRRLPRQTGDAPALLRLTIREKPDPVAEPSVEVLVKHRVGETSPSTDALRVWWQGVMASAKAQGLPVVDDETTATLKRASDLTDELRALVGR